MEKNVQPQGDSHKHCAQSALMLSLNRISHSHPGQSTHSQQQLNVASVWTCTQPATPYTSTLKMTTRALDYLRPHMLEWRLLAQLLRLIAREVRDHLFLGN
eukprot:4876936-Amphidinium_carterae.2